MKLHRNSQKRIYREAFTYFIVTKTYQNYPYFKGYEIIEGKCIKGY